MTYLDSQLLFEPFNTENPQNGVRKLGLNFVQSQIGRDVDVNG